MIDLTTVTPSDNGREVRYTSTSGTTVQLGKFAGDSGSGHALVVFHTKVLPKPGRMAPEVVECDAVNLEFVDA